MEIVVARCIGEDCGEDDNLFEFEANGRTGFACQNHLGSNPVKSPSVIQDKLQLDEFAEKFILLKNKLNTSKLNLFNFSNKLIQVINLQVSKSVKIINKLISKIDINLNLLMKKGKISSQVLKNLDHNLSRPLPAPLNNFKYLKPFMRDLQNFSTFSNRGQILFKHHKLIDSRIFSNRVDIHKKFKLLKNTLLMQNSKFLSDVSFTTVKSCIDDQKISFLTDAKFFQISLKRNLIVTSNSKDEIFFWTLNQSLHKTFTINDPNKSLYDLILLKKSDNLLLVYQQQGFSLLNIENCKLRSEVFINTSRLVLSKLSIKEDLFALGDYEGFIYAFWLNHDNVKTLLTRRAHYTNSQINSITCIDFSQSSEILASGGNDGHVFLYKISEESNNYIEVNSAINAISFSPNQKMLLIACENKFLKILDLSTNSFVFKKEMSCRVKDLQFGKYSQLFLTAGYGQVVLWHFNETKIIKIDVQKESQLINLGLYIPDSISFKKYLKNN